MTEPAAEYTLIAGRITGCYGIKGWVKIHPFTDPAENFLSYGNWRLRRRGQLEPIEFDAGRRHGKGLVAHIVGVEDRTQAETYRGLEVVVRKDSLPALQDGDFYWHQLQGLQVWCRQPQGRVLLGTVDYLIETGANDVLVVKASAGSIDRRERLIPYVWGEVVKAVNLDTQTIEVDWFVDV